MGGALPAVRYNGKMPAPRTADPYRDLAVIDSRAPRANQLLIGTLALASVLTGAWPLAALAALQLAVTLALGRRFCLACRVYFGAVQPLLGEGPVEDARPVKFANQVGLGFLSTATLAHLAGLHGAGNALAGAVATLALVAAGSGLCAGCLLYRGWAFVRGVRGATPGHVDLAELGCPPGREAVVQFTHPLCSDCQDLAARLREAGLPPVLVDVSRRPDLARKYGVAVVPLAVAVRANGSVERRLH
jgi:Domain of unknown function (DUF4395)